MILMVEATVYKAQIKQVFTENPKSKTSQMSRTTSAATIASSDLRLLDIDGSYPFELAYQFVRGTQEEMKRKILANTYGSAPQTRTLVVLVIKNSPRIIDSLQVIIAAITLL